MLAEKCILHIWNNRNSCWECWPPMSLSTGAMCFVESLFSLLCIVLRGNSLRQTMQISLRVAMDGSYPPCVQLGTRRLHRARKRYHVTFTCDHKKHYTICQQLHSNIMQHVHNYIPLCHNILPRVPRPFLPRSLLSLRKGPGTRLISTINQSINAWECILCRTH